MKPKNNQAGFTLIESLVAMFVLGIILAGLVPGFLTYLQANTRNEMRTEAVQAAQIVMEAWRIVEPVSMPTGPVTQTVTIGRRDYQVLTRFCSIAAMCVGESRHLTVEVSLGQDRLYSVETVFTALS